MLKEQLPSTAVLMENQFCIVKHSWQSLGPFQLNWFNLLKFQETLARWQMSSHRQEQRQFIFGDQRDMASLIWLACLVRLGLTMVPHTLGRVCWPVYAGPALQGITMKESTHLFWFKMSSSKTAEERSWQKLRWSKKNSVNKEIPI